MHRSPLLPILSLRPTRLRPTCRVNQPAMNQPKPSISDIPSSLTTSGFTMIEILVVLVIAGVLAAIAAPGWLSFTNGRRITTATDAALQAVRAAQANASRQNRAWEASFIEKNGELKWGVHVYGDTQPPAWIPILGGDSGRVTVDDTKSNLNKKCEAGDYCVRFDDRGVLDSDWLGSYATSNGKVGLITVTSSDDNSNNRDRRCVVVATILGTIQVERDKDCSL